MKPTAVEWLVEQLPIRIINSYQSEIAKALEMEKEQIETAYNKAVPFKYGKEYYNETFKK